MESVSAANTNPERFLYENGVCATCAATDVTRSPRPQNLNPLGINFTDCEQNLRMDFTLVVSGFSPGDDADLQAWAGSVDCTQDTNRSTTGGGLHPCWQVSQFTPPIAVQGPQTLTVSVYARDLLRYSGVSAPATPTQSYDPGFNASAEGESACHVQVTDAVVPLTIYFIPVNATSLTLGSAFSYSLRTDLVAPPPPCTIDAQGGAGSLDVQWASVEPDPDRVGFEVFTQRAGDSGCALPGDSFAIAEAGAPSCQTPGISAFPSSELAGVVASPTATSFTVTALGSYERYAAAVMSTDGSGNVGPPSSASCAEVEPGGSETGEAADAGEGPKTVTAGCGCTSAGATPSSLGLFGTGACLFIALGRRRRHLPSEHV